jgi:hypothetical protein
MTPTAKADYLLIKFNLSECTHGYNDVRDLHAANRCAIIAVDEILKVLSKYGTKEYEYWEEVKNELEKYDT